MGAGGRKKWKRGRGKGGRGDLFVVLWLATPESLWSGKEGNVSCLGSWGVCPEDTTPSWLLPLTAYPAQAALPADRNSSPSHSSCLGSKAQFPTLPYPAECPTPTPPSLGFFVSLVSVLFRFAVLGSEPFLLSYVPRHFYSLRQGLIKLPRLGLNLAILLPHLPAPLGLLTFATKPGPSPYCL